LDESKRVKAILHFLTHFQVGSFVSVDPIDLAFVAQELGIFPEMLMRFLKTENIVELHHSFTEQERLIYKQSLPKIIDLYSNLFEPSDDVFDVNKLFHSINFELQKSYQFVCELGRGSFGSVHKACYGPTGKFYAIKQMYVESADPKIKEAHKAELENENAILDYINKDRPSNLVCIIRKIAAFIDAKKDLYLVLELGRCNLFEKICRDSYLTTSARFIRQFVKQMLEALRFLQSKNIVHADVKPGNILYNEKEQFVLADFGAAFIEPFVSERDKNGKILLFRRQTTDYRSPECTLFTEDYTDKIDMWSLGCICAELFFNAILFKKETSLELYRAHRERIGGYPKSLIKRSHRPRIVRKEKSPLCNSIFAAMKNRVTDMPLQEKELFINLLQKNLLVINPSKRASAQAASGHKYCAIDL
jgi:serine/threonine protein kinase